MNFSTFQELFVAHLYDLYNAEMQTIAALPTLINAAQNNDLKSVYEQSLKDAKIHIDRIEEIFFILDLIAHSKPCFPVLNLFKWVLEHLETSNPSMLSDSALIFTSQKIGHYKIASYEALSSFAHQLGFEDIAALLRESLQEETTRTKQLVSSVEEGYSPTNLMKETEVCTF